MARRLDIRVGCCGFQMSRPAYFERFRLTEVQQTFYQPPRLKTLERWRAEAPSDFEFTMKAWQLITHTAASPTYRRLREPIDPAARHLYGRFQPSDPVLAAWKTTLACARALKARLIVFQCPASFTPTDENVSNLRAFFRRIRRDRRGLLCGWEPRGDWPPDLISDLVGELDLLHIVDPFAGSPLEGQPTYYFRLHGKPGAGYRYSYGDAELRRLLGWCRRTTYVLFNNVTMVADAQRFLALLPPAAEAREGP